MYFIPMLFIYIFLFLSYPLFYIILIHSTDDQSFTLLDTYLYENYSIFAFFDWFPISFMTISLGLMFVQGMPIFFQNLPFI